MHTASTHVLTDAKIQEAARLFGILSEPSRLYILRELMEQTQMKQGNVSKHLGVLLNARYVAREREGNFARYSITDPRLYQLCELMCARIEDDVRQRVAELAG